MESSAQSDTIEWLTRVFEAAARPPSIFDAKVFAAFTAVIAELVPHDRASIFLVDVPSDTVQVATYHARVELAGSPRVQAEQRFRNTAEFRAALVHGELRVVDDTSDCTPRFERVLDAIGVKSYLLAPILLGDASVEAWLAFMWHATGAATHADAELVARVAQMLKAFIPSGIQTTRSTRLVAMLNRLPHGVLGLDDARCVVELNDAARVFLAEHVAPIVELPFEVTLDERSREVFRATRASDTSALVTLRTSADRGGLPIDVMIQRTGEPGRITEQIHIEDARARLASEAELKSRAEALAFLRELDDTVAGELDSAVALGRAITLVMDRLAVRAAAIAESISGDAQMRLVAERNVRASTIAALLAMPRPFGTGSDSIDALRVPPEVVASVGHDGRVALVPLRHAEQLVGVALFVLDPNAGARDRELLVAAARSVGVALHAAQEYAEVVRLAAERRQLLDSMPTIVFRLEPRTGATLYANAAVERVLGTPVARALGIPGIEGLLADSAEREQMAAARRSALDDADPAWVDRRFSHVDGRTLVLRTRLYLVETPSAGSIRGAVIEGIARDVTDEIDSRRQLVQADRLASLGMLAAGVAHEINNPTAFISLGVQQLARIVGQMPDEPESLAVTRRRMSEVLSELGDGVQRIVQIVGELKLFARIPEKAFSTPVDVNRLITSAVTLARSELRRRARVEMDLGELPPLPGDHARLGQVFVNLVVNAAQAIQPGNEDHNVVSVRTRESDSTVIVEVSDTGVGIPPENIPRIFDPFFTTKPPGEGTGLGLAISYDLVRRAGGTIEVESKPGRGTKFTVRLPVRLFVPERGPVASTTPVPAGGRVLVVEDEQHLGVAIARALAATYMVELAPDATIALERIERGRGIEYDAVLCDLRMPGMDGRTFYETVRRRWPEQARRFVFLTGTGFGGEFESFIRTTDRPILEKPFDMDELSEMVARVVAGESVVRNAFRSEPTP